MQKFIFLGLLWLSAYNVYSQSYFQQQVDYKMVVTLDTTDNRLAVSGQMIYHNNSETAMDYLLVHLWWNAFSDKQSAFALQQYKVHLNFHFAAAEDMGGYESLEFVADETPLTITAYEDGARTHPDIVRVDLAQPIPPGTHRTIAFSYNLDIPKVFSRPGFDGQLYRMTQWYPKPAVFDNEGWHPMPYLAYGEYFAEYGDYEVELRLPSDHSFGATGVAVEGAATNGGVMTAKNVLDFAWFSSADFDTSQRNIELDGKPISLKLLSNANKDQDALLDYVERALRFYSAEVGSYPYPQYTLVYNEGLNRGGMEYPMISMVDMNEVGQNLDNLIAHEIGHNWFQSILGSNERKYPWMDEGLNSFYERAYNDTYYKKPNFNIIPKLIQPEDHEFSTMRSGVSHYYCCGKLTCVNTPSAEEDIFSYGSNNYERMAWNLKYLQGYLGEDVFRLAMQSYYTRWAHQHPSPEVLQNIFEEVSGKDLSWFYEGLLKEDRRFDLTITDLAENKATQNVTVITKNKTDFNIPYSVSCYDAEGKLQKDIWVEGGVTSVEIPAEKYDRISINGEVPFIDSDRTNNHIYPNRLLPKARPLKFGFIANNADSRHHMLSFIPFPTFNVYDGLTLNGLVYSDFFPYRKLRAFIQPAFGLESRELVGRFGIERDLFLNEERSSRLTLGVTGARYNYLQDIADMELPAYWKLLPSLQLHFKTDAFSSKRLEYKLHVISTPIAPIDRTRTTDIIHQLNYRSSGKTRLGKKSLLFQVEYENYEFAEMDESYLKLTLVHDRQIHYSESSKFFIRFFGGYFPHNTRRESASFASAITRGSIALTQQGYTDHTFEGYYLGRTEQDGLSASQFALEEGGFKLPLSSSFPLVGNSNDWGITVNLKADLPIAFLRKIGLRPWVDVGLLSTKSLTNDPLESQFYWAGGLAIELGEYAGIYVPLFYSSEFDVPFAGKNLISKVSFKIDLQKINPWRMSEGLEFAF